MLALIPGFEHDAADGLSGQIQLKDMVVFRMLNEFFINLAGINQALVERGVRRCRRKCKNDTLIFLRRQLTVGTAVEEVDTAQDDNGEYGGDRQIVERLVQHPRVELL